MQDKIYFIVTANAHSAAGTACYQGSVYTQRPVWKWMGMKAVSFLKLEDLFHGEGKIICVHLSQMQYYTPT